MYDDLQGYDKDNRNDQNPAIGQKHRAILRSLAHPGRYAAGKQASEHKDRKRDEYTREHGDRKRPVCFFFFVASQEAGIDCGSTDPQESKNDGKGDQQRRSDIDKAHRVRIDQICHDYAVHKLIERYGHGTEHSR